MRGNWLTQVVSVALSMGVCSMIALPSSAQPPGGDCAPVQSLSGPDKNEMGVSMTIYHVMVAGSGQQMLLTPNEHAIPLPGAGVEGHRVAVYHGSHGGTWYVDKTGQQVEIPGFCPGINGGAGFGYQPTGSYYGGPYCGGGDAYNSNSGYQSGYAQQPAQDAPKTTSTTVVVTDGVGNGGGAFAGGVVGSALGTAVSELANGGGLPFGAPVYYGGGGGSYYYGGGGRHVVVNNNSVDSTHYNEWHNQQNWYHNQFNQGGRYHGNYWPGKDRGFPRPGDGGGRLYGGDDHHDDHHDNDHKAAGGGAHRADGHKAGGGRKAGGGGHHGGGGHRK